jgi:hypothetical protein
MLISNTTSTLHTYVRSVESDPRSLLPSFVSLGWFVSVFLTDCTASPIV